MRSREVKFLSLYLIKHDLLSSPMLTRGGDKEPIVLSKRIRGKILAKIMPKDKEKP